MRPTTMRSVERGEKGKYHKSEFFLYPGRDTGGRPLPSVDEQIIKEGRNKNGSDGGRAMG